MQGCSKRLGLTAVLVFLSLLATFRCNIDHTAVHLLNWHCQWLQFHNK